MRVKCTMILGDCLDIMPTLKSESVGMVFADFPYATPRKAHTTNKWDIAFDIKRAFAQFQGVAGAKSRLIFTCGDRLAARLAFLFDHLFRYTIVYEKPQASLYLLANKRPLVSHELIQVFGKGSGTYNPQKQIGMPYTKKKTSFNRNQTAYLESINESTSKRKKVRVSYANTGDRFPRSVMKFAQSHKRNRANTHPTQKPIALLDWLIRTYSNVGDTVLDPVSGSFTTSVAACLSGRSSVGIEKDLNYFEAGVDRVRKTVADNKLDVAIEVRR